LEILEVPNSLLGKELSFFLKIKFLIIFKIVSQERSENRCVGSEPNFVGIFHWKSSLSIGKSWVLDEDDELIIIRILGQELLHGISFESQNKSIFDDGNSYAFIFEGQIKELHSCLGILIIRHFKLHLPAERKRLGEVAFPEQAYTRLEIKP
jgi:hypothetical protein